jgi:hypothetical protein
MRTPRSAASTGSSRSSSSRCTPSRCAPSPIGRHRLQRVRPVRVGTAHHAGKVRSQSVGACPRARARASPTSRAPARSRARSGRSSFPVSRSVCRPHRTFQRGDRGSRDLTQDSQRKLEPRCGRELDRIRRQNRITGKGQITARVVHHRHAVSVDPFIPL